MWKSAANQNLQLRITAKPGVMKWEKQRRKGIKK